MWRNREGLAYLHPVVYGILMRLLYGAAFSARYEIVARLIPSGCRVLDLCCGDALLYRGFLGKKGVSYTGMDFNGRFAAWAGRRGADIRILDIRSAETLPKSDVVVMMGSLYHFIPEHERMMKMMLAAASRRLIISEPMTNVAASRKPFLARLARFVSRTRDGGGARRFTEEGLRELFERHGAHEMIDAGKDLIGVWNLE